jgi:hypothetical protein
MTKSTDELIQEFLNRGGSVSKILTGRRSMTNRELHLAVRGELDIMDETDENIAERRMETVCEAALTGGRQAAIQALNDFNDAVRDRRRGKKDRARQDAEERLRRQEEYNERWGVDY